MEPCPAAPALLFADSDTVLFPELFFAAVFFADFFEVFFEALLLDVLFLSAAIPVSETELSSSS